EPHRVPERAGLRERAVAGLHAHHAPQPARRAPRVEPRAQRRRARAPDQRAHPSGSNHRADREVAVSSARSTAALWACALLLAGCTAREYSVVARLASTEMRARVASVELYLVPACGDLARTGATPAM